MFLSYHLHIMLALLKSLLPARKLQSTPIALVASLVEALPEHLSELEESTLLQTVGWISAGMGALALGLFVGRELRQRYKFNRRTPYDFYAHSGDEHDLEFGVGV